MNFATLAAFLMLLVAVSRAGTILLHSDQPVLLTSPTGVEEPFVPQSAFSCAKGDFAGYVIGKYYTMDYSSVNVQRTEQAPDFTGGSGIDPIFPLPVSYAYLSNQGEPILASDRRCFMCHICIAWSCHHHGGGGGPNPKTAANTVAIEAAEAQIQANSRVRESEMAGINYRANQIAAQSNANKAAILTIATDIENFSTSVDTRFGKVSEYINSMHSEIGSLFGVALDKIYTLASATQSHFTALYHDLTNSKAMQVHAAQLARIEIMDNKNDVPFGVIPELYRKAWARITFSSKSTCSGATGAMLSMVNRLMSGPLSVNLWVNPGLPARRDVWTPIDSTPGSFFTSSMTGISPEANPSVAPFDDWRSWTTQTSSATTYMSLMSYFHATFSITSDAAALTVEEVYEAIIASAVYSECFAAEYEVAYYSGDTFIETDAMKVFRSIAVPCYKDFAEIYGTTETQTSVTMGAAESPNKLSSSTPLGFRMDLSVITEKHKLYTINCPTTQTILAGGHEVDNPMRSLPEGALVDEWGYVYSVQPGRPPFPYIKREDGSSDVVDTPYANVISNLLTTAHHSGSFLFSSSNLTSQLTLLVADGRDEFSLYSHSHAQDHCAAVISPQSCYDDTIDHTRLIVVSAARVHTAYGSPILVTPGETLLIKGGPNVQAAGLACHTPVTYKAAPCTESAIRSRSYRVATNDISDLLSHFNVTGILDGYSASVLNVGGGFKMNVTDITNQVTIPASYQQAIDVQANKTREAKSDAEVAKAKAEAAIHAAEIAQNGYPDRGDRMLEHILDFVVLVAILGFIGLIIFSVMKAQNKSFGWFPFMGSNQAPQPVSVNMNTFSEGSAPVYGEGLAMTAEQGGFARNGAQYYLVETGGDLSAAGGRDAGLLGFIPPNEFASGSVFSGPNGLHVIFDGVKFMTYNH